MNKILIGINAVAVIICIWSFGYSVYRVDAKKVTCASFASQKAAQLFYQNNPIKYGYLDGDKDGVACESLK